MSYQSNLSAPMQSIFWSKKTTLYKQTLLILAGVFVLALASQLSIPLKPVPLTFQSATVILIGMAYGARNGAYVVISYFIAGICGIPVFADFSFGIEKFFGPTSGYLIGFLPAVILSGYLAQKGWARNIFTSFIAALLGVSVIFMLGVTLLSTTVGWQNAVLLGVMPFILSEIIKLIAVSCLVPRLWKTK